MKQLLNSRRTSQKEEEFNRRLQNVHHKEALAEKLAGLGFVTKGHFQGSLKGFTGSSGFRTHNTILITRQREGERERQRQRDREGESDEGRGDFGPPKTKQPNHPPGSRGPTDPRGETLQQLGIFGGRELPRRNAILSRIYFNMSCQISRKPRAQY